METNNHIKRFYMKIWNDTWSWLKSLIKVIAWIHVAFAISVGVVYTGALMTDWLYGPIDGVLDASGGTILSLGVAPYITIAVLYFVWKYLKSVWNNTSSDEVDELKKLTLK